MNDRAKQIVIVLIAARLIPWIQKFFGVTLSLNDIGDLFSVAVIGWHSVAASVCAITKRYFPLPSPNPTQPVTPAGEQSK